MSDKTFTMFAAVNVRDSYRNPVYVNWYAHQVRKEAGLDYNGEDHADGWKLAMQHGWRVRKVHVVVPLP